MEEDRGGWGEEEDGAGWREEGGRRMEAEGEGEGGEAGL